MKTQKLTEDRDNYFDFDNKQNRKMHKTNKTNKRKQRSRNEDLKYNRWN